MQDAAWAVDTGMAELDILHFMVRGKCLLLIKVKCEGCSNSFCCPLTCLAILTTKILEIARRCVPIQPVVPTPGKKILKISWRCMPWGPPFVQCTNSWKEDYEDFWRCHPWGPASYQCTNLLKEDYMKKLCLPWGPPYLQCTNFWKGRFWRFDEAAFH